MAKGDSTWEEIISQPHVWRQVLDAQNMPALIEQAAGLKARPWVVTGCGSTYYLALHAADVLRRAGIQAAAYPGSELAFFGQTNIPDGAVLLAISRSGTTTETLWAVRAYRSLAGQAGRVVVITCEPGTPLAQAADLLLLAEAARERSVAQTRSFTSMALLVQLLAGALSSDPARLERMRRLPGALELLLRRTNTSVERWGQELFWERIFFLGSGPLYGLACEAMLKTKEMSLSGAEAYHTLEFRHGPMSMVDGSTMVIGLLSDTMIEAELKVLREMRSKNARVFAFCEERSEQLDWHEIITVDAQTGLSEEERGVIYLPLIQEMAFFRALAKDIDPDHPRNLNQVIRLDP